MKTVIFIFSILIGLVFLFAGIMKLYKSYESEASKTNMNRDNSISFIRFISWCEIVGALLFVIPYSLNFLPSISIISAFALTFLMVGAPISHIKMGEHKEAALTTSLLILILLVTFFRVFVP